MQYQSLGPVGTSYRRDLFRARLRFSQVLVDGRPPHAEHLCHIVRRTLAFESAVRVQRCDQFSPMVACQRIQRDLPLVQPAMQKRIDALLPVVLEQFDRLRDNTRAAPRRNRSSVERISSNAAMLKLMHIMPAALVEF